jgi:methionyl-tRNA formyltransferase
VKNSGAFFLRLAESGSVRNAAQRTAKSVRMRVGQGRRPDPAARSMSGMLSMKLMLVGQKWLGTQALVALRKANHEVLAVAAPNAEDRLWMAALQASIPAVQVGKRLDAEHVPAGTELIVCAHAHCFISDRARQAAQRGAIGYHPSLLPLHRGRDAIEWALRFRERITGGTVYWMDDRADAGPVTARTGVSFAPKTAPMTCGGATSGRWACACSSKPWR